MLKTILEKMLVEEDFLLLALNNIKETSSHYNLSAKDTNKLNDVTDTVFNFFSITNDTKDNFFSSLQKDITIKSHFVEYAHEKLTYLLASERSNSNLALAIVWVSSVN